MNHGTPANAPERRDVTDAKRAELLHDHYTDTFEHILYHWKARNRMFMFILILLALIGIDLYQPSLLCKLANAYVKKQFDLEFNVPARAATMPAAVPGATTPSVKPAVAVTTSGTPVPPAKGQDGNAEAQISLDTRIVGSMAWFLLLCLVINYYQRSIHVDRQYNYISHVEGELNRLLGKPLITREGRGYFSHSGVAESERDQKRPPFLRAVGMFYSDLFPVALIVLTGYWLWINRSVNDSHGGFSILNAFSGGAMMLCNVLYLHWKHTKKTGKLVPEGN